jgi:hypothetical protein
MSSSRRRYEILLPQRFNNNKPVPDEFFADTITELRVEFGAVSTETQVIHGVWEHEHRLFRDQLIRIFVDVEDSAENQLFFQTYKERLKERFQQLDIRMTTYLIEVY